MHRFLPALIHRAGWQTVSVPVNHRPRTAGISKYGMWNRLWVGIADLRGVAWLARRSRRTQTTEITLDRKSVVSGKSVSVRVDLGGRRIFKKTTIFAHPYLPHCFCARQAEQSRDITNNIKA